VILYFLRHADAGQHHARDDDARALSAKGVAAMHAAAELWQRLHLRPDVVVSSPLLRAAQTAELFVEGVGVPRAPVLDQRLAPGATWGDMGRAIADHPDARRVMFVGHEPDLSAAIAELTGAASVRMRKGGLACVEFYGIPEPGTGELAWLLDPDLYQTDHPGGD
jgi:phosphohistidine phosphatase